MITNLAGLLETGQREMRAHALEIIDFGICASDPAEGTYRHVRLTDSYLHVGTDRFKLNEIKNIYVIGAGKGSYPIAQALESILGDRISEGLVIVKRGETRRLEHIDLLEAGHPVPDENSVIGARRLLETARKATSRDLVFAAVTGGASALATLPPPDISLAEIKSLTGLLLRCGAPINDINIVRKHLCELKGGRLVARIQPAQAITLTLDTQPEGGMAWPDVSLADPSTFNDAIKVLHHYDIWEHVAPSIKAYLIHAKTKPELETIKDLEGMRTCILSVGDPLTSCEAGAAKAKELGYKPVILSTFLEGEARETAKTIAGIAMEIIQYNRPFQKPCALISGGELTVTLSEESGLGGPSQEFAVSFAASLRGEHRVVCAALDTDGTDGPTDIAGGIVDGSTASEAISRGINLEEIIKKHDSSHGLNLLNGAVITGHTGTNVLDLRVILIR